MAMVEKIYNFSIKESIKKERKENRNKIKKQKEKKLNEKSSK